MRYPGASTSEPDRVWAFDLSAIAQLAPQELLLLLDLEGTVCAARPVAAEALGLAPADLVGAALPDLSADRDAAVEYLRACRRSSGRTPGALRLGPRQRSFRCDCVRIAAIDGSPALAMTLRPREEVDRFVLLGQKLQELNCEIARRRRVESAMVRIQRLTAAFAATRTLEEVAEIAVEQGVGTAGAIAGALFLCSGQRSALELVASSGYPPAVTAFLAGVPTDQPLPISEAVRSGRAIYVRSLEAATDRYPGLAAALGELRSAAFAAMPLVTTSGCLGALLLGFAGAESFTSELPELAGALTDQCAVAIERVSLFETESAARRRATEAERKKDEFLAILGHELRNPLAPIMTALELMRFRDPHAFARERTVIERQARHLSMLVDDLLDLSRITSGKIELRTEPQEISLVVERAIEMTEPLLEKNRIELVVVVPRRGLMLEADHDRLAQVLANLLNNAAKYTDPGGRVEIRAERAGDDVVLRVRDSGAGISPELLPDIFDIFVQDRGSAGRSQGGLGLGLTIVKRLVDLHRGTITAHSEGLGRGSEFVVRLPAMAAAAAPAECAGPDAPVPEWDPAGGVRVLVVDDNEDAALLLVEGLAARGYTTRAVLDGPSALSMVAEFCPDVALLDIGLPIMDGYELARVLRSRPETRTVPLIAVTAYGQDEDRERTRRCGFAAHMVKPVDLEALSAAIRDVLHRVGIPAAGAT